MRNSTGWGRAASFAALATLAGCGPRGASPKGPIMGYWTPAPPGATWEVAERNTGSYGHDAQFTLTREDLRWKGTPVMALRASSGPTIVAEPVGGRTIAVLGPEGDPLLSYDPPVGWVYPLNVGKTWSQHEHMTLHAVGKIIEFDLNCEVEDYENLTVRAGNFNAFRIHCSSNNGSDETYWTSPRVGSFVKTQLLRAPSSPFGAGTQQTELVRRPSVPPHLLIGGAGRSPPSPAPLAALTRPAS